MPFRRSAVHLMLLGLLALPAGCSHESRAPAAAAPASPARVRVAAVRHVESAATQELVGTVRPKTSATIASSVMGTVSEIRVSLGSRVRAGDVLVRLRANEIGAKLRQAAAAHAQAKLELDRARALRRRDVVSQAEVDALNAQYRIARAAHSEAKVLSGYTTLRAPFSGVVSAKLASAGDLALPGRPLLTLEDPTALRLEATVPEASSGGLEPGHRQRVRIDALNRELEGVVAEVSPAADPGSRTVLVKLDLPPSPELFAGMFGRMELATGKRQSLQVPPGAIVRRGQLELVFVADGAVARLRLVRVGRARQDAVELLSGVEAGERVITSEPRLLADGQQIEVLP